MSPLPRFCTFYPILHILSHFCTFYPIFAHSLHDSHILRDRLKGNPMSEVILVKSPTPT